MVYQAFQAKDETWEIWNIKTNRRIAWNMSKAEAVRLVGVWNICAIMRKE